MIGARDPSGFELCGATQDTCRFVRAQLQGGGKVLLTDANARAATRVRFCWADSPLCNLYDGVGTTRWTVRDRREVEKKWGHCLVS